jgi:hypothetical protein
MACTILQLPHSKGGWGLSPLEGISTSAFFASVASFVRWSYEHLPTLHANPTIQFDALDMRSSTNSLFAEFVGVYDDLVLRGASVVAADDPPPAPAQAKPTAPSRPVTPHRRTANHLSYAEFQHYAKSTVRSRA